jgi:hypothetical protein
MKGVPGKEELICRMNPEHCIREDTLPEFGGPCWWTDQRWWQGKRNSNVRGWKMKRKCLFVLAALALLAGCATADRMNGLSIGMTREQVISVMGAPDTTGAQGNNEYLIYRLSDTKLESLVGFTEPYVVELKEGKVDAFGKRSGVFLR